jgi:hypothetical protein
MKAQPLRITGILMALSLSCASVISCNVSSPSPTAPPLQVVNLQTEKGQIRLNVSLPTPKAYTALKNYHDFHTASIEESRINRIKVTIEGTTTEFKAEKVIPISQGGMTATIKVPLGKNFLLTVQGMDDLDDVPGARVKSVFSVESAEETPDVDVTPLTTAMAEVVERVKARDAAAAANIDSQKLLALIEEGKSAANPFLVNFNAFADALVASNGVVPSIVPSNPVLKPGNIAGGITGLKPGDTALVFSNDPVSEPFLIVAPPLTGEDTIEDRELEFRIDNVPAGDWVVRVVASGYQVQGDNIESLNELSATKKIVVDTNKQTTTTFEIKEVGWGASPINASGNIGSSDQLSAVLDGSDDIHAVWRQDGFQENEEAGSIFYSRWNGKTWSTDNRFISPPGDNKFRGAREPNVAVGTDRTPHVVWSANSNNSDFRGRRVAFSRFDGVNWSKPLVISSTEPQNEVDADHPSVAINPINGQAFAVWDQLNNGVRSVYLSQRQGDKWLNPILLSEATTQSIKPIVTVGTDGWVRVVWEVLDTSRVQYIEWDGKNFSTIEEVPFNQSGDGQRRRNLAASVDRLNRLHLIRRVDNTIQYLFRSNNSWSKTEFVHEVAGEALPVLSDVTLTLDPVGNVNAAWGSSLVNGTPILRYRRRTNTGWDKPEGATLNSGNNNNGVFPTPTPLPTATTPPATTASPTPTPFPGFDNIPASQNKLPVEEPQIVVDSRGRMSVMWSDSSSDPVNSEIYHSMKSEPIETN